MRHSMLPLAAALMTMVMVGCIPAGPAAPAPNAAPSAVPSATPTPAPTKAPTPTPNPFPNPVLKITGPEEVVFDWSKDRCEDFNFADLPARAIRGADGQVQLILSDTDNYRMTGPDLNTLVLDCQPVMRSQNDADPALFADNEWIASLYTEDGTAVYALVHNEYWGHTHSGQCPQQQYFPCWDNSITLAVSQDGGRTYEHARPAPAHLVARLPYQYEAGAGPEGARSPSNIIRGKDGYFYSFFNVSMFRTQAQRVCLMRTGDIADPSSWRFWDGSAFEGRFVDPYPDPPAAPSQHLCEPMDPDGATIGGTMNESITYSTYLNRYVLVGISADQIGGREVWGIYYAYSADLLHWSHRKLLAEMPLPWTAPHNDDVMYLYPSLLDPASDSLSFETTGKTAYLYYTRFNHGQGNLDRDLLRVPVEFFPKP